jgi:hypothetical protein
MTGTGRIHGTTTCTGIENRVMQNPLDGVTLGDGNSGTCVESSNTETIVITLPPGCRELFTSQTREGGLRRRGALSQERKTGGKTRAIDRQ